MIPPRHRPAPALLLAAAALSSCSAPPAPPAPPAPLAPLPPLANTPDDSPQQPPTLRVPTGPEPRGPESRLGPGPPSAQGPGGVLSTQAWTYNGRPGVIVTTPRFKLYTTLEPSTLRSRVPAFLEHALRHYTAELADLPMPRVPLETYLMASRPQWVDLTRRVTGPRAQVYERIPRGGYAFEGRAVYWDIGEHDTLQIAAHEGWHQYTQAALREPLPSWLEEGLACYMEGFRWHPSQPNVPVFMPWANTERFDALRALAAQGRLVSLDELVHSTPDELVRKSGDDTLGFYAQAWALVHFMAEGERGRHRPGLLAALRDAAAGTLSRTLVERVGPRDARAAFSTRRGDAVIRAYLNADPATLHPAYEDFVRRIVRTGGRDAVVAGRSPVATD